MTIFYQTICGCLLWCLPVLNALAASEADVLAAIELPEGATLLPVSSQTLYNGNTMAIAALRSPQSASAVIDFFKRQWRTDDDSLTPGFVQSTVPGWQLISRLQGEHNIVVQLREPHSHAANASPHAGTNGYVSVASINSSSVAVDHGSFSNLQTLFSNETVDGSDTSKLRVYASPTSLSRTHDVTIPKLLSAGWQVLADTPLDEGWVTMLSRRQARLELSFVDSRDYALLSGINS